MTTKTTAYTVLSGNITITGDSTGPVFTIETGGEIIVVDADGVNWKYAVGAAGVVIPTPMNKDPTTRRPPVA